MLDYFVGVVDMFHVASVYNSFLCLSVVLDDWFIGLIFPFSGENSVLIK